MEHLIASLSTAVPEALREVITLGRTLKKRAADILAYFDRPHTSHGPTEAVNGRLEHQITTRDRRNQTPTTPSFVKSHLTAPMADRLPALTLQRIEELQRPGRPCLIAAMRVRPCSVGDRSTVRRPRQLRPGPVGR
jgi:hypothetical protein